MKKVFALMVVVAVLLSVPAIPATAATCQAQHTVKTGEYLVAIARLYSGVDWRAIATANNLANPSLIYPGQVLCIPVGAGTPVPTQPTATPTGTPRPATPTPTRPPTTATPVPTARPFVTPTFTITAVARDQTVTIQAVNFPPNQRFDVRMGAFGTLGIGGMPAGTQDTGNGAFTATYNIPGSLRGSSRIAIRLENPATGYFSYNWFYNNNAP